MHGQQNFKSDDLVGENFIQIMLPVLTTKQSS
jgi:hypothetical protein